MAERARDEKAVSKVEAGQLHTVVPVRTRFSLKLSKVRVQHTVMSPTPRFPHG